MSKHISDTLYRVGHIMSSDEDQPIIMDLLVGFNFSDELVIVIDLFDYEEPAYNCSTAAIVNTDDARIMARRHNIAYSQLPRFIAECMAEWRGIINPGLNCVRDCFKEIT
ncbi:hypothetical protein, partial [uncultured Muribaculum sp.]